MNKFDKLNMVSRELVDCLEEVANFLDGVESKGERTVSVNEVQLILIKGNRKARETARFLGLSI